MSAIVAVLKPGSHGHSPLLRVRCLTCGRIYQTKASVSHASRTRSCNACKNRKAKP